MSLMLSSPPKTERRTLGPTAAYAVASSVIGLALVASITPSPLYGTYRELWGFSPLVLTLVYATYAFGVLATLILAGRVSDQAGRRPVLLVALGTLMVTSVLYMLADSVVWLFVARGLQGLATGLALGAASAAMLDLHPRRDPSAVGLANGVLSAGGIGLGMLASATLVELAPAPRVLPYVLLFLLFAIAFAGTLALPEPVEERTRPRLTPQRPSVPVPVRRAFLLAALAVISSWSIGGLFFSLGPQLSAGLFDSTDHLVTALGVFLLAGAGSLAQLAFGRARPWVGAVTGSIALATGMLLIVGAVALESPALFIARLARRRRRLRRRVPRRPARAVDRDPARPSRGGDVGVLRRRLPVDLGAGDPRGAADHAARARHDVRGLRRGRRRARAGRRGRGVADAPARRPCRRVGPTTSTQHGTRRRGSVLRCGRLTTSTQHAAGSAPVLRFGPSSCRSSSVPRAVA